MSATGYVVIPFLHHAALSAPGSGGSEPWLSAPTAAVIVGIAGCVLGVLGALMGRMAFRGGSSRTLPGVAAVVCGVGAGCVAAGVAAVVSGQPGFVFYPLCVLGGLLVLMVVIALVLARRALGRRGQTGAATSEG